GSVVLGWKVVRSAKGSVGAVCRAPMHNALSWQQRLRPPAGWQAAPPLAPSNPGKIRLSAPRGQRANPPKKLAGWLAGCPRGPDAERPGDTHETPKGANGTTRPQTSPLGCRSRRASPTLLPELFSGGSRP